MIHKNLKQIYVSVPSRTFDDMIKFGLIDKSLDAWFIAMVQEEIATTKEEIENRKNENKKEEMNNERDKR